MANKQSPIKSKKTTTSNKAVWDDEKWLKAALHAPKVHTPKSDVPVQSFEELANLLGLEAYFGWQEAFSIRLHCALESAYRQGFEDGSQTKMPPGKLSQRGLHSKYKKLMLQWTNAKRS